MPWENVVPNPLSTVHLEEDKRRSKRINLQVPLFVRSRDFRGDPVMELAKTLDISALGAMVACPCQSKVGEILTLTIPAPSITSNALVPAGMPPLQAKVIRVKEAGDMHLIGVEFLEPIG
jgi:hypothetical protein